MKQWYALYVSLYSYDNVMGIGLILYEPSSLQMICVVTAQLLLTVTKLIFSDTFYQIYQNRS